MGVLGPFLRKKVPSGVRGGALRKRRRARSAQMRCAARLKSDPHYINFGERTNKLPLTSRDNAHLNEAPPHPSPAGDTFSSRRRQCAHSAHKKAEGMPSAFLRYEVFWGSWDLFYKKRSRAECGAEPCENVAGCGAEPCENVAGCGAEPCGNVAGCGAKPCGYAVQKTDAPAFAGASV